MSCLTNEIDMQKKRNTICAFIVHTQESRLMMHFIMVAQRLQTLLNKLGFVYYNTPNYDCFGSNYNFIIFLRYHLEHSYNYIYKKSLYPAIITLFKNANKHYSKKPLCSHINANPISGYT